MKLLAKSIDPHGAGFVKLLPQESDDMWHAYNLIVRGDVLTATTFRKVVKVTNTGSTSSDKMKLTLSILVEKILFDARGNIIRISGRNRTECSEVKIDARHTIELELGRPFTINKSFWDSMALERVRNACDPSQSADVAAVMMEAGVAHICLITETMTIIKAKVEKSIPKKHRDFGPQGGHDKALDTFFEQVKNTLLRCVNFDVVKCVIVASSGFVKDQFLEFLFKKAQGTDKVLLENRAKFLPIHSSSGHMVSLKEILADPAAQAKIADSKAAGEARALQEFYDAMKDDPDRAVYGVRHVQAAHEQGAIKTLLILDALFRSPDVEARKKYAELVESVKAAGGKVFVFSSLHHSGQQLAQLTGAAAVLRYPMPELDEQIEGDDNNVLEDERDVDNGIVFGDDDNDDE